MNIFHACVFPCQHYSKSQRPNGGIPTQTLSFIFYEKMEPNIMTITRNEAEQLVDAAEIRSSSLKQDDEEILISMELSSNHKVIFRFDRKSRVKSYHLQLPVDRPGGRNTYNPRPLGRDVNMD